VSLLSTVFDFESALAEGVFRVPECTVCSCVVWPPSEFCSRCLGAVSLRPQNSREDAPSGHIVELSSDNTGAYFCLAELEHGNIRLIASLRSDHPPSPGDGVILASCGIDADRYGIACYRFEVECTTDV